jgi:Tfp pilus assembly protein FimT
MSDLPRIRPSAAAASSSGGAARGAFTLLEMLIVLVIIMVMMGLVIGALGRGRNQSRLLASEAMIADLIREARHTAASSGSPVEITVAPVVADDPTQGWQIAGVSRIAVWSETFDGQAALSNSDPTRTVGLTGYGRTAITQQAPYTATLSPAQQLVRGGHGDGFYLACAVRCAPITLANPQPIPLLIIASGTPDIASSLAGMLLQPVHRTLQPFYPASSGPGGGGGGGGASTSPQLVTYECMGWVHPCNPSVSPPTNSVSSILTPADPAIGWNPQRDEQLLHPSGSDHDIAGPIAGGTWEEFGLLYDGQRLSLYRNGVRIAEAAVPDAELPAGAGTIYLGQGIVTGVGDNGTGSGSMPTITYSSDQAIFDDLRLYRLGTDQLGHLPAGVVVQQPFQLVAQPDGRLELEMKNQAVQVAVHRSQDLLTPPANGAAPTPVGVIGPDGHGDQVFIDTRPAIVLSLQMHGDARTVRTPFNALVVTITAAGSLLASPATWETASDDAQLSYPVLVGP